MSNEQKQCPQACAGVMILKEGNVLLHLRKGSHGEGQWAFPGGDLEYMESFEDCARREMREECGLEIDNMQFQCLANLTLYPPIHRCLIGFVAHWKSGEPQVLEPDKGGEWGWYNINHLPEPMFEPSRIILESYKTGKQFYDTTLK